MTETQMRTPDGRTKLLNAALAAIRRNGYAATSVDQLCREAGVTKGAFFHHFPSKEALAVAAAEHWSETTGELFRSAPYRQHADPLERVLGYIAFRKSLIAGDLSSFTCLVGTMAQEVHQSSPNIRTACDRSIRGHAETLVDDFAAAARARGVSIRGGAEGLALHTQAVIQGAFVLAKAADDPAVAAASIDHLDAYIRLLFQCSENME